jgi:hypothetical protein
MLAGLPVRDQGVLEIAGLLRGAGFDDTAGRLEDACDAETRVLALTIPDREAILRALEAARTGLRSSAACSFASTSGASA